MCNECTYQCRVPDVGEDALHVPLNFSINRKPPRRSLLSKREKKTDGYSLEGLKMDSPSLENPAAADKCKNVLTSTAPGRQTGERPNFPSAGG